MLTSWGCDRSRGLKSDYNKLITQLDPTTQTGQKEYLPQQDLSKSVLKVLSLPMDKKEIFFPLTIS